MARGRFITFEGGDGSGKTTQVARLVDRLKQSGFTVVATREPGGTPFADAVRTVLLSGAVQAHGAFAEALLFSAARSDHLDALIRPALGRGDWVVCDRFADSTRAYQGAAGGAPVHLIDALEAVAVGGTLPDLTLILDLPVEEARTRAANRRAGDHQSMDRFERAGLDFHRRLRSGYLRIAAENPERCVIIDARRNPDAVAAQIWDVVSRRFSLAQGVAKEGR